MGKKMNIVERLRAETDARIDEHGRTVCGPHQLCQEAADEIERLRRQVADAVLIAYNPDRSHLLIEIEQWADDVRSGLDRPNETSNSVKATEGDSDGSWA